MAESRKLIVRAQQASRIPEQVTITTVMGQRRSSLNNWQLLVGS